MKNKSRGIDLHSSTAAAVHRDRESRPSHHANRQRFRRIPTCLCRSYRRPRSEFARSRRIKLNTRSLTDQACLTKLQWSKFRFASAGFRDTPRLSRAREPERCQERFHSSSSSHEVDTLKFQISAVSPIAIIVKRVESHLKQSIPHRTYAAGATYNI